MNVDSDKALSIATADPCCKTLKLKASQMWLDRSEDGPGVEGPPVGRQVEKPE